MEPADAKRDDLSDLRRLDGPSLRRIAAEPKVRPVRVVVRDILAKQPEQVPLIQHDDVVEQLSSKRPDEPLDERVLPGRPRR